MMSLPADPLLRQLGGFIAGRMGLHFPPDRTGDLQRGLQSAAREFGFDDDAEACAHWLLSVPLSSAQVAILAGHLTVGETYFFRDRRSFELLEQHVWPELLRRRRPERRLRLWSAACCTGEEPYSLAIALRRVLPDLADWSTTLLGTDINPRFLEKAAHGVFGEWSFREAAAGFREQYFSRLTDGRWQLHPEIRAAVRFSPLNLAADAYPSLLNGTNGLDLIFCRNALIYFSPEQATRVVRRLACCLAEGGWLVLGPNETTHVAETELTPVRLDGAIFFRKDSPASHALAPPKSASVSLASVAFTARAAEPSVPAACEPEPPPLDEQARAAYEQGRYAETEVALAPLASRRDADVSVLILLARALANQGRLDAALAACDRIVATEKTNLAGHHLRAGILQELGRPAEAAAALKRTLYLQPDFVSAHFELGNLALGQGRAAEADRHFKNTLALVGSRPAGEILPETDGLTAGRLAEIVATLRKARAA